MKLPPFLLDQWLQQKFSANPPIEFDLGSSTGPTWTLRELLALGGDIEELLATNLFYTPPEGSAALREELARMHGVEPERVLVMTGASEALLVMFHLAAEPGANVVLPSPGFPANEGVAESLGLEVRHYTLRAKDNFQIDLDEVRKLVDRHTKLVLVNSPHNPTGAVLGERLRASGLLHVSSARGGVLDRNSARHCPARTACFVFTLRAGIATAFSSLRRTRITYLRSSGGLRFLS